MAVDFTMPYIYNGMASRYYVHSYDIVGLDTVHAHTDEPKLGI